MNLERIEQYYEFKKAEYSNLYECKKKGTARYKTVSPHNPTYFVYDYNPKSIEEAEELVKQGLIDKVEGEEFYREYAGLNEEELVKLIHHMDLRSYNYLQACKNNIGFIETIENYEELDDNKCLYKITDLNYWDATRPVYAYKLDDGTYATQHIVRTAIDDYVVIKHYFNRKPSKKDFLTITDIEAIEHYLLTHSPSFNCWECGAKTHWTEIPGNLSEKLSHFKNYYCNNC